MEFTTDGTYDYTANGPIISDRAIILRGVKFQVNADGNIHIAISKSNPIDPNNSWELFLGGSDPLSAGIVRGTRGTSMVTNVITKQEFLKFRCNFDFKMTSTTIGLYEPNGEPIVEYVIDSTGYNYLYITTCCTDSASIKTPSWIIYVGEEA